MTKTAITAPATAQASRMTDDAADADAEVMRRLEAFLLIARFAHR